MLDLEDFLREYLENGGNQKDINDIVRIILSEQPIIEVVISECEGGFSLSEFACECLGIEKYLDDQISRTDPTLISLIKNYGVEKVSGTFIKLRICECPVNSDWYISSYDGYESLHW